ncbi:MAG TPA: hypothetical protein V6C96_00020 [Vampirovibrionales bacterium]
MNSIASKLNNNAIHPSTNKDPETSHQVNQLIAEFGESFIKGTNSTQSDARDCFQLFLESGNKHYGIKGFQFAYTLLKIIQAKSNFNPQTNSNGYVGWIQMNPSDAQQYGLNTAIQNKDLVSHAKAVIKYLDRNRQTIYSSSQNKANSIAKGQKAKDLATGGEVVLSSIQTGASSKSLQPTATTPPQSHKDMFEFVEQRLKEAASIVSGRNTHRNRTHEKTFNAKPSLQDTINLLNPLEWTRASHPSILSRPRIPTFQSQRTYYTNILRSLEITSLKDTVEVFANKSLNNKSRYENISKQLGGNIPWQFIAAIHMRESSQNFNGNLANGQPLNQRTTIVPIGKGPYSSFEESAVEILRERGLDKITNWTPERVAWELEKYNGLGYLYKGKPSPYLLSGSKHYASGKYVADGKFDANHKDKQIGALTLIKAISEKEAAIA